MNVQVEHTGIYHVVRAQIESGIFHRICSWLWN